MLCEGPWDITFKNALELESVTEPLLHASTCMQEGNVSLDHMQEHQTADLNFFPVMLIATECVSSLWFFLNLFLFGFFFLYFFCWLVFFPFHPSIQ